MSAHPIFEHLFANLGLMKREERDHEAINGICVHKDDWDLPLEGNPFDDIPEPIDPYRQLSGDEE